MGSHNSNESQSTIDNNAINTQQPNGDGQPSSSNGQATQSDQNTQIYSSLLQSQCFGENTYDQYYQNLSSLDGSSCFQPNGILNIYGGNSIGVPGSAS